MNLRRAQLEDLPAIMAIIRKVVPLMRASGNMQWDDTYPNPEVFARDIAKKQLWVAEVANDATSDHATSDHATSDHATSDHAASGSLAGVAAITDEQEPEYARIGWDTTEPAIVVHRVAVDPGFRGRGIAEALMRQAEAVAAERSISVLRVDTNTRNQATQKLFPKLGYTLSGETELGFRPDLRFLCYEKRLS